MTNFWKNKKVLVAGGAGFIGSHTVDALIEKGAKVVIVSNGSAKENKKAGRFVNSAAKFYNADATSAAALAKVFNKEKPELVMNFAALADIPLSIREPGLDAQSIIILINLLENSLRYGVKKIVHASSGFIYGNTKKIPTPETESARPINPYAISKIACENYLKFFQSYHGLPFVALRYANVYGPRRKTGVIAYFIREIIRGSTAEIYGAKTRDCIFISDVVRANLLACEKNIDDTEPIFNIGSGEETSLAEIHTLIKEILAKPQAKIRLLPRRFGEVDRGLLDIKRAKKFLGFSPRVKLKDGLRQTIRWYINQHGKNG